mmetsp:Transcript_30536/g.81475  ORF Transcript_30536/g.81475 Transcript_30536/m.81475 type:complete len:278 (+) Transcript_30536:672-1505(+)
MLAFSVVVPFRRPAGFRVSMTFKIQTGFADPPHPCPVSLRPSARAWPFLGLYALSRRAYSRQLCPRIPGSCAPGLLICQINPTNYFLVLSSTKYISALSVSILSLGAGVVGFFGLVLASKNLRGLGLAPSQAAVGGGVGGALCRESSEGSMEQLQPGAAAAGAEGGGPGLDSRKNMVASSILLTALIINSMMTNTVGILWPLFMQRHFQWTDSQYSYLLLAAGISSSVALGVLPTMQKRVGPGLTRVAASEFPGIAVRCQARHRCISSTVSTGILFC